MRVTHEAVEALVQPLRSEEPVEASVSLARTGGRKSLDRRGSPRAAETRRFCHLQASFPGA